MVIVFGPQNKDDAQLHIRSTAIQRFEQTHNVVGRQINVTSLEKSSGNAQSNVVITAWHHCIGSTNIQFLVKVAIICQSEGWSEAAAIESALQLSAEPVVGIQVVTTTKQEVGVEECGITVARLKIHFEILLEGIKETLSV